MIPIIQIDDKLVSADVLEKCFACDIETCAGICCVWGDSGAPLDENEPLVLAQEYPHFMAYMKPAGRLAIERQGISVIDSDGDRVTPLIDGKECAYSCFDRQGVCYCAIERAYFDGKTTFRKPISCWLYPIRLKKLDKFIGLNYDQWHVCACAREKGHHEKTPVYRFLKDPIIQRFGALFYEQLDEVARTIQS